MKNKNTKNQPSAGRLIGMIHRCAHVYFKHEFKDLPLGHAQIFTMHHLIHHDGISQKELTKYTKLDKGSITSQLHYLENNGYITRKQSKEDARVLNLFITEKTKEKSDKIQSIFKEWTGNLLKGFDEQEKEEALKSLIRIAENAENKIKVIKNEK